MTAPDDRTSASINAKIHGTRSVYVASLVADREDVGGGEPACINRAAELGDLAEQPRSAEIGLEPRRVRAQHRAHIGFAVRRAQHHPNAGVGQRLEHRADAVEQVNAGGALAAPRADMTRNEGLYPGWDAEMPENLARRATA